jgi:hypothetical protein
MDKEPCADSDPIFAHPKLFAELQLEAEALGEPNGLWAEWRAKMGRKMGGLGAKMAGLSNAVQPGSIVSVLSVLFRAVNWNLLPLSTEEKRARSLKYWRGMSTASLLKPRASAALRAAATTVEALRRWAN